LKEREQSAKMAALAAMRRERLEVRREQLYRVPTSEDLARERRDARAPERALEPLRLHHLRPRAWAETAVVAVLEALEAPEQAVVLERERPQQIGAYE